MTSRGARRVHRQFKEAFKFLNLDNLLAECERGARVVLRNRGFRARKPFHRPLPESADGKARAALELLFHVHCCRLYLREGDASNAAFHALKAGAFGEHINLFEVQRFARGGLGRFAGLEKGRRTKAEELRREGHRKAPEMYRDLVAMRSNPHMSLAAALKRVGQRYGYSGKQAGRILHREGYAIKTAPAGLASCIKKR